VIVATLRQSPFESAERPGPHSLLVRYAGVDLTQLRLPCAAFPRRTGCSTRTAFASPEGEADAAREAIVVHASSSCQLPA